MRILFVFILLFVLVAPGAGQHAAVSSDFYADFPPIPPVRMYEEVYIFRAEVERQIARVESDLADPATVVNLVDTLISRWDWYGDYMDREHGDFPNMSRNRPYWLITTDEAADTLTDRLGSVLESYVQANEDELLGPARVAWEEEVAKVGLPRNRLFGFQFVELARLGSSIRNRLAADYPDGVRELDDAYVRFLWDLMQFYRQLHATWYDRHTMAIAREDWTVYRTKGLCEDPKWELKLSFTAIGVDTSNMDPMNDKFMHRLVLVDAACPETVDFIFPLRHYRLMEKELNQRTEEQRREILERYQREAIERGIREGGTGR
jgi:hypothetical protein